MHIMRDFTLFLASGCFMVVSGIFGGINVNFHVFEALACILRLSPYTSRHWKPLCTSKDSRAREIALIQPNVTPIRSNEASANQG